MKCICLLILFLLHQTADFPTLSYTSTSDNQKPEKGTCTSLASNSRGTNHHAVEQEIHWDKKKQKDAISYS